MLTTTRFTLLSLTLAGSAFLAGCGDSGATNSAVGNAGTSDTSASTSGSGKSVELINVSYDPTRELYADIDKAFSAAYKKEKGVDVTVKDSHGGSGKQARTVADGADADVVTLALAYDIDSIAKAGLIDPKWQSRLPQNSTPYTSTIVFLVRKGNPKGIKDWSDIVKPGVQVVTPSPKTSGGARWSYLAAWGYALHQKGGSDATAKDFVTKLYKNVPTLDTGARGATTTFTEHGIGDVLLTWENEALLTVKDLGKDKYDIVVPSESILAEPPVAVVDSLAKKRGTTEVATAYLKYLYTPEAQEIEAKNFYRPRDEKAAAKYAAQFPKVKLFTLQSVFGDWTKAQKTHFADGGTFDQIYAAGK